MGRARRRYELRDAELDGLVDTLVERACAALPSPDGSEYARQIVISALGLLRDRVSVGDLKLVNSALKELRHSFRVFAPYEHIRKVAVFGSARTLPDHPDWRQAHAFAERVVSKGWMVITGAGPGIMNAVQGGAGRDASFGVNIRLPFEQQANEVIAADRKLINFRYFFTRKITFVKEAHAIALFPGGFGTHDEGFEALTLIQTGKSEILPVVFIDAPGGTYWRQWKEYVDSHLRARGLISADDFALFKITDDVEAAIEEIEGFYANYHSSRYVGRRLVIRLRQAPDPRQLEQLNDEFRDIIDAGCIRPASALPEEEGEAEQLPRILFEFNRRDMGRLRMLIDRLNGFVAAGASPPAEASPHAILAEELSPEAERAEQEPDRP